MPPRRKVVSANTASTEAPAPAAAERVRVVTPEPPAVSSAASNATAILDSLISLLPPKDPPKRSESPCEYIPGNSRNNDQYDPEDYTPYTPTNYAPASTSASNAYTPASNAYTPSQAAPASNAYTPASNAYTPSPAAAASNAYTPAAAAPASTAPAYNNAYAPSNFSYNNTATYSTPYNPNAYNPAPAAAPVRYTTNESSYRARSRSPRRSRTPPSARQRSPYGGRRSPSPYRRRSPSPYNRGANRSGAHGNTGNGGGRNIRRAPGIPTVVALDLLTWIPAHIWREHGYQPPVKLS